MTYPRFRWEWHRHKVPRRLRGHLVVWSAQRSLQLYPRARRKYGYGTAEIALVDGRYLAMITLPGATYDRAFRLVRDAKRWVERSVEREAEGKAHAEYEDYPAQISAPWSGPRISFNRMRKTRLPR